MDRRLARARGFDRLRPLLFNSLDFLLFFLVVLTLYFLLRQKWKARKVLLLVASYAFYMAWNPPFVLLLLGSTLLDYSAARRIERIPGRRGRLAWLLASCIGNLGVLAFFKYGDFLVSNIWWLFEPTAGYPQFLRELVLPVGISFYTFQSLSYTIDVYRGVREPTRNLLDFALYVAFFPQLVAGPILRAGDFLPQLDSNRQVTAEHALSGANQAVRGFAKKILIADVLAEYVDIVYGTPGVFGAWNQWIAIYAYAFQIYFDFSGYSDIAIGTARMLGFRVPENFRLPYLSGNLAEFWTRWHISLSSWLRDYLYISLGGSRVAHSRVYSNLMITMLLGGLWHGAAWGFVLWGAYHGLGLVIHRTLFRERTLFSVPRPIAVFVTFHLVCLGWVFFRAESLPDILVILRALTDFTTPVYEIPPLVLVVLPLAFLSHALGASSRLREAWNGAAFDVHALAWCGVAVAVLLLSSATEKFIYFQF